ESSAVVASSNSDGGGSVGGGGAVVWLASLVSAGGVDGLQPQHRAMTRANESRRVITLAATRYAMEISRSIKRHCVPHTAHIGQGRIRVNLRNCDPRRGAWRQVYARARLRRHSRANQPKYRSSVPPTPINKTPNRNMVPAGTSHNHSHTAQYRRRLVPKLTASATGQTL